MSNAEQLVDLIQTGKMDKANDVFSNIMIDRTKEAIDAKRIEVSRNMFNFNHEEHADEEVQ